MVLLAKLAGLVLFQVALLPLSTDNWPLWGTASFHNPISGSLDFLGFFGVGLQKPPTAQLKQQPAPKPSVSQKCLEHGLEKTGLDPLVLFFRIEKREKIRVPPPNCKLKENHYPRPLTALLTKDGQWYDAHFRRVSKMHHAVAPQ